MNQLSIYEPPRAGLHDLWNAFMVSKASFDEKDIPNCSSTSIIPEGLIAYDEAKTLYNRQHLKNPDFYDHRFIHFYIDDLKFDGPRSSIWLFPYEALKIISHFAGIITPDFSTNCDFPYFIKGYNTYRTRAFGCWMNQLDIAVINNVRWGTDETWDYCFKGIPKSNTVCIGTVASGLRIKQNHDLFNLGFERMIEEINPSTIIIYGSENYSVIEQARKTGIEIISFPSQSSLAFRQGDKYEQTY